MHIGQAAINRFIVFFLQGRRSLNGVSVKRGVGAGVGIGISLLYIFFNVFFLYFNRNSDFSQFVSAVYCYNIFRYKEDKNVVELIFSYHPKQSRHIPVEFFSSSTPISATKSISKSSQWKIKRKVTAELTINIPVAFGETLWKRKFSQSVQNLKHQISNTIYHIQYTGPSQELYITNPHVLCGAGT